MKQLRSLRILSILGIVTVTMFFATGLSILLLSINKTIDIPLVVGIILFVWSIIGFYFGLFTSIWLIVAITPKRIIKFMVKSTRVICFFSLNPFVIAAGIRVTKTANIFASEFKTPIIDTKALRQKMYQMMASGETKID